MSKVQADSLGMQFLNFIMLCFPVIILIIFIFLYLSYALYSWRVGHTLYKLLKETSVSYLFPSPSIMNKTFCSSQNHLVNSVNLIYNMSKKYFL